MIFARSPPATVPRLFYYTKYADHPDIAMLSFSLDKAYLLASPAWVFHFFDVA